MSDLRLFDTRTRRRHPLIGGRTLRLYVCGITPYDATHLGHAFTYTVFDVLIRYLEHRGHVVRYARNVTDVDDDILRTSRERNEPAPTIAAREVERFDRSLALLGLRTPDAEPWASETIPAIVTAVDGLVRRGAAYPLDDGRVYFDTRAWPRFGDLSQLDRAEMLRQFAEKGGDPDASGKRNALDFLLWHPSADGEPAWASPFGPGRPGWHIECSVMAAEELGPVIDIHGGGSDLVFPHHEAEACQAEALTGQHPFARFWLHVAMVGLDGEKMSKSLGNLVYVPDLVERHQPGAVRRYLLEHHYRTPWEHTEGALDDAAAACKRWVEAAGTPGRASDLDAAFHAAMCDDLDTPTAVRVLDEAAQAGAGTTLVELAGLLGIDLTAECAPSAEKSFSEV